MTSSPSSEATTGATGDAELDATGAGAKGGDAPIDRGQDARSALRDATPEDAADRRERRPAVGASAFFNPEPRADRELVELVRSIVLLAIVGASVALALGQLVNGRLAPFVSANGSTTRGRNLLLLSLAVGAGIAIAVGGFIYARARRRPGVHDVAGVSRLARLAAPLALTGALPSLLALDAWPDALKLAICMSVFLIGMEPLFRLHFSTYREPPTETASVAARWRSRAAHALTLALGARAPRLERALRRWGPAATVAAMAGAYVAYMSFFTVRNHHRFNTFTWDLGQITNQFYNFLHGHPFRCTALIREGNWSELRNHAEATMVFLLPFYAVRPSAETLLVLQATLLGLAGIPLYRFAARRLPRSIAVVLTAAYYLYPPLHGAQFFDIHFQPLAAAFLLTAIDAFDARRMRLFAVFFALAILCREDISIGTAVFGLFLIVTRHRARAGVVILLVSLAYFVLLRFFIMPSFGSWGFAEHYRDLFPENERSFGGIIKTILTNPVFTFTTLLTADKLRYLLQLLVPLAFLPVRRAYLAMSILPGAYFTVLTTEYAATLDIGYQYSGYFIPYLFPAAALALASLVRRGGEGATPARGVSIDDVTDVAGKIRRRAAVATLIAATVITTTQWGAIPPRRAFHSSYGWVSFEPPTPEMRRRLQDIRELDGMVPKNAILAVSDKEMPHVADRVECWNVSVGFQGSDYILYDTINPIAPDISQVRAALAAGYVRVAERPGLALLKKPGR